MIKEISKNTNYTAVNMGKLSDLKRYVFQDMKGKVFLKNAIGSTGQEVSFQAVPPHTALPFFHSHKQNEEVYIILKGEGQFQVDDEAFSVTEGSIIRIAPKGDRSLNNTSDAELIYMVVQAKDGSLEQYTGTDGILTERAPKWK